jgi:uncharacterized membrane protein (DUF106 family)
MDIFNSAITNFFDLLCSPFASLDPWWGLTAISVLTGIVMLVVFRLTSNQEAIRNTKNRIKAYFLEVRLYSDDLGLMFSAQGNILRTTLTYMRYSLKPMLFLIVPVVLIMIQLSLRYDRYPLRAGESAVVKVTYADRDSFNDDIALQAPEGIAKVTPPVRIREEGQVLWRIKALEEGLYDLSFTQKSKPVTKRITVSDNVQRVSVRRVGPGFRQQLLYPGEKSIPAEAGIKSIEVSYPSINYAFLGWTIHWLVIFFVVSIAAGFALKGIFKVEV